MFNPALSEMILQDQSVESVVLMAIPFWGCGRVGVWATTCLSMNLLQIQGLIPGTIGELVEKSL